MKILVTGATGFLGKVLIRKLLEHGEKDIRCLVRDKARCEPTDRLTERHREAAVEHYVGDLLSPDSLAGALAGVGLVLHLAAMPRGSSSGIFLNTVVGSRNLIETCLKTPTLKKFVLVSSIAVHDTYSLPAGSVVDEETPLDGHPEKRDVYTHSKIMQEQLFRRYADRFEFDFVVVRPAVIYGPEGTALPARVGLQLPGLFLHLGGGNQIPITYVDNCAEAIIVAARSERSAGQVYDITDDNLPSSKYFLKCYRKQVRPIRFVRVPYPVLMLLSRMNEAYFKRSKGQLPALFTPYKTGSMWKPMLYNNSKIKSLGWSPAVGLEEALRITFEAQRRKAFPSPAS
jgi:nucleoside-diphosphate-sugar epimerase